MNKQQRLHCVKLMAAMHNHHLRTSRGYLDLLQKIQLSIVESKDYTKEQFVRDLAAIDASGQTLRKVIQSTKGKS